MFTFTIKYHDENLFEILYSSPNSFSKTWIGKILDCLRDNKYISKDIIQNLALINYGWVIQNVTEFVSIALFYKWQFTRMMTS